jgi:hypothetical protein
MTFLRLVTSHVQSSRRKQSNVASKTVKRVRVSHAYLTTSPRAETKSPHTLTLNTHLPTSIHNPTYITQKTIKKETKASYTPSKDVSTTELITPIQGCGLTYPEGFEPSTFA